MLIFWISKEGKWGTESHQHPNYTCKIFLSLLLWPMPIAHLEWKGMGSRVFLPATFLSYCALCWGISYFASFFSARNFITGTTVKCFEIFWANAVMRITAHNPAKLAQLDTIALRSSASACQGKRTAPKAWWWIKYWLFCIGITCLEVVYFKGKAWETNPKQLLSKLLLSAFRCNHT